MNPDDILKETAVLRFFHDACVPDIKANATILELHAAYTAFATRTGRPALSAASFGRLLSAVVPGRRRRLARGVSIPHVRPLLSVTDPSARTAAGPGDLLQAWITPEELAHLDARRWQHRDQASPDYSWHTGIETLLHGPARPRNPDLPATAPDSVVLSRMAALRDLLARDVDRVLTEAAGWAATSSDPDLWAGAGMSWARMPSIDQVMTDPARYLARYLAPPPSPVDPTAAVPDPLRAPERLTQVARLDFADGGLVRPDFTPIEEATWVRPIPPPDDFCPSDPDAVVPEPFVEPMAGSSAVGALLVASSAVGALLVGRHPAPVRYEDLRAIPTSAEALRYLLDRWTSVTGWLKTVPVEHGGTAYALTPQGLAALAPDPFAEADAAAQYPDMAP